MFKTLGEEKATSDTPWPVWPHILFWLIFSIAVTVLRGIRWDENYEFAQVIARIIPYPEGHPIFQYTRSMYSLQPWSLAALMHLTKNPLWPNLMRNVLFLMATVLPPFLFTRLLTRKALWGYGAVSLILLGIHIPFFSNYPVQVWPNLYSNGPVGMGWALISLYLILAGNIRLGYLMFALMPAVHLGQFPALLGFVALRLVWAWRHNPAELHQAGRSIGFGLTGCLLFYCIQQPFAPAMPETGPYAASIAPEAVFKGYMAHHASHRSIPWGTGHIPLIGLFLLGGVLFCKEGRQGKTGTLGWLILYGGIAAATAWGIMLIHLAMGANIPWLLISWLPYRLMNHVSPILIPIVIAVIVAGKDVQRRSIPMLFALLAGCLLALLRLARRFLPDSLHAIYEAYFQNGEAIYFFLFGAALFVLISAAKRSRGSRAAMAVLTLIAITALAWQHQWGAFCVGAGGLLSYSWPRSFIRIPTEKLILPTAILLLLLLTAGQACPRRHLPVSPFEHQVREFLAQRNEPNAMILVRHQQEGLQARLHHPVMTDMATMTWIPYKPSLGPGLHKLYMDLYGINFAPDPGHPAYARPWFDVWPAKTTEEWHQLGLKYNFKYVLAPAFMQLNLRPCLRSENQTLYEIPAANPIQE